ncbi:MAG TPA: leucyl/phenylalanyl-tRNA--protein transferase [Methylophilaceae bacterium]
MSSGYYRLPGGLVAALQGEEPFPPLNDALKQPNGLLAIGGDLSTERLLDAYRHGIFPWFSPGEPILWWSPHPRMVMVPAELHISRSLQKRLKRPDYKVSFNRDFRQVMNMCATVPRDGQAGTWIVPEMIEAYCELHRLGYAHSVEVWQGEALVGGLYGVALGQMFFAESMFHLITDASKIALITLVRQLQVSGVGMMDCQLHTQHLASLGAREISRDEYSLKLSELIQTHITPVKLFYDTLE